MKEKRVKYVHQPDWFSQDIADAIKSRNRAKKLNNSEEYKFWRQKVKCLIHESKKSFYTKSIYNNKNNPKIMWKHLRNLSNKSTNYQTNFIVDNQGDPITNPGLAAETFNEFFLDVFKSAPKIDGHINKPTQNKIKQFIQSKLPNDVNFNIPLISEQFVLKQLQALDITKSTGVDNIGARFLKIGFSAIAKPLTKIFNLSLKQGTFPQTFKIAKITPIHKKGDKNDKHNYRPISILPVLSKIMERHVCTELKLFLEKHRLLHVQQSGFRENHSCETALTVLIDEWITSINNHNKVGAIFLDLTKAFDLINHSLLIEKLKLYQMNTSALNWFESYLTNRTQRVVVSGNMSDTGHITSGVPQGSVLGPLLFIIYINDLPLHVTSQIDMFADDTTISASGKTHSEINSILQADLRNIEDWCLNNSMLPNAQKTKAMYITPSSHQKFTTNVKDTIKLQDQLIQFTTCEKLLGINVDNNLTWKTQVEQTIKKCNSLLYLLLRIKCYLNIHVRKLFFNSYILPHLDYCCTVWGNCSQHLLQEMMKFQKRAARVILDKDYDTPSTELFRLLGWMKFDERVKFKKALLVYKSLNNKCPEYMSNMFQTPQNIHSMTLRSESVNTLMVPKPNYEFSRKSFSYSGAKLWNSLPLEIQSSETILQFKSKYLRWKFPESLQ